MPNLSRVRASRILVAAALVGVAITMSACVSDSAGSAFGAPTATPIPSVPAPTAVPTAPPIPQNEPAAYVAGTPIAGKDYAAAVAQLHAQVAYQAQQQPGGTIPTEQQIRAVALGNLIDQQVVSLYARGHGITVTTAQLQSQYDSIELQLGGPITFTQALANYGYTKATFRTQLRLSLLRNKVENKIAPLPVSVPEVRARHILVKTKALADQLYAELQKDPGKFAALAKKYSTDTGSKANGGELGFFPHGQMVAPFDQAAFSQPVGAIGKPVKSQFGYHIIQVEARKKVPFGQLDSQTQQTYQTQQQTKFQNWITAQRKRLGVRVVAKGVTPSP